MVEPITMGEMLAIVEMFVDWVCDLSYMLGFIWCGFDRVTEF